MFYRRRRYTSRRRSLKRRASPKKYYSKRYPIRKAIVSVAKKVKKLQSDVETKVIPYVIDNFGTGYQASSYTGNPVSSTFKQANPRAFLLNGLNKGVGQAHRIGDDVRLTSVHVTGQIQMTDVSNVLGIDIPVRIMLVSMKKPRGQPILISFDNSANMAGNPSLTGLFNVQGAGNPTTYTKVDTQNAAYEDYKVHYDRIHRLRNNVGVQYAGTISPVNAMVNPKFDFNIKKKIGLRCDYSRGDNQTWTDFEKNALWLLFITDTTSDLTISLDNFTYFKDA